MEPADARNGSEHAESVDNECVKTASPSQSSATCVNRHVTKGGRTGGPPAGNPASGGDSSCHPLAAQWLAQTVCYRTRSRGERKLPIHSFVGALSLLILKCHSGSS